MLKSNYCTTDRCHVDLQNFEEISNILTNPENILWIDALNPTPEEMQMLQEEFDLHPLAVEDTIRRRQRPKIEEYMNHYFVVFYDMSLDPTDFTIVTREIFLFFGKNYLLTVHDKPIPALEEAEKRWKKNVFNLPHDAGLLVYSVLDALVDQYYPALDDLIDAIENLEDVIFEGKTISTKNTRIGEMLTLRRSSLTLRRIVSPERDVLNVLIRRDTPIFDDKALLYFQDIYDHLLRAIDTLDLCRDMLSSAADANLAIASNDLNVVMRKLTTASIILMANSLIAGIYGMNFENMPELKFAFGYPLAIVAMIGISLLLVLYFRRIKWL